MLFRYKKSLDKEIGNAVAKSLKVNVLNVSKIKSGEVNHVYKIETDKKALLARVFRYDNWPEDGKLRWIDRQFTKYNIPHAKLLYLTRSDKWFPNGFMVTDYIEGKSANDAVKSKELSRNDYYIHVARLLKKVHGVRVKKFGDWHGRFGTDSSLLKFLLRRVVLKASQIKRMKYYDKNLEGEVSTKLISLLGPVEKKLKPVLTHGDPGKDNCIWTKKGKLILIDWDNARSSSWLRDYADLMFWESYSAQFNKTPKTQATDARKSFLRGYGKTGLTNAEINRITLAFFIVQ